MRGKHLGISFLIYILTVLGARAGKPPDKSPALSIKRTPQRLARGKYIVEGPAHCFLCHSEEDFQHLGGQPIPGMKGAGRIVPPEDSGVALPNRVVCSNLTPDVATGAGKWKDEDFVRAIRNGIGHDGRVLSDYMPYWNLRYMTDEDLASVIAYVRSIPPVRHELPKTQLPEPAKVAEAPLYPTPAPPPGASPQVLRGVYLVRIGNCSSCHDGADPDGKPIPGLEFAGGQVLTGKWGIVAAQNLTPDTSGISYFDEKKFIEVLRTGHVGARKLSSIMPWSYFRHMTDEDLKAIFAYLRTLPPVRHRVDNTEPPTYCPKCRNRHGLGDRN
jgi:Cytochrome c/Cytochrome C oxidase, cbb3-type, subunit III